VNNINNVIQKHIHIGTSVPDVMLRVCVAMIPGLLCYIWFFGWGIFIQCLLVVGFALALEYLMLKMQKKPVAMFLKDGSAIVTALLLALTITPFTPWWISFIGISFAIIFTKHLYGGLGFNPFNPAMAGYVFILLCFPAQMNTWPPVAGLAEITPGFSDYLYIIFTAFDTNKLDALSGASPLNNMKSELAQMSMISELVSDPIYGTMSGKGWEWINFAFLAGGLGLLFMGITKWQIPVAMLASMFILSSFFNLYNSDAYAGPLFHLFSGGTMLGIFFIATDPVTASTTPKGRLIYGAMIGILAYSIRVWGSYPDGIAFAVLLANIAVPLIDLYTRPKVLGESKE